MLPLFSALPLVAQPAELAAAMSAGFRCTLCQLQPDGDLRAETAQIPALDLSAWPATELMPNPERGGEQDGQSRGAAKPDADSGTADSAQQKKQSKYSKSATAGSPGHIFWIVPAFKVNYAGHFKPLTPKEKFQEWAQSAYDPLGLGVTAIQAGTLEYSSTDGFCGYGMGFANYGKCFGSMELDANDSSFLGDFVFTVWWHQDPRYFRLGHGGFGKRTFYAISRVFVTYNDSGKNVFYSSGLAGTGIASVVSNLYYPKQDRGVGLTMSRVAIDLGDTALYNGAAEFWPDIHRWVHRRF